MSTTTESTLSIFAFDKRDILANAIPSLPSLGSTYNILNGLYADAQSCTSLRVVVDWPNSAVPFHNVTFGNKVWGVPDMVNYNSVSRTEFNSTFGNRTEVKPHLKFYIAIVPDDASKKLGAEWPFFSRSVSVDFSQSERNNLVNAFTRVTNEVSLYTLSLPPLPKLQKYLHPAFVQILDSTDPQLISKQYGTHLVSNMIIGGCASFTCTTNVMQYSASNSIKVAVQVSVKAFMARPPNVLIYQRVAVIHGHDVSKH
ncbi:hypothetical protein EDD18DRAFT_1426639 [Armillaria luteobubalina]|uniref:MACPF domain-containing protein n=1 Tax=Armillaria luteobubalina TaxID=153913 RepID=A0AA39QFN1_9AGAR|nr:hypothetical protein EDD18DRAFT_1426639 [Armillaria luteobubalina]